MMTEWKNRTITLYQDGKEFGKVNAALADSLLYSWANDLLLPEDLQGKKPEEYISQRLGLQTQLPASALHQLAREIKRLKETHGEQILQSTEGQDQTGKDLNLNILSSIPAIQDTTEKNLTEELNDVKTPTPEVPQFVPPQPKRNRLENMLVKSPEEATLLCKILFMIMWGLNGMNEQWALNVFRMAGYDPMEIRMQLERIRQRADINDLRGY